MTDLILAQRILGTGGEIVLICALVGALIAAVIAWRKNSRDDESTKLEIIPVDDESERLSELRTQLGRELVAALAIARELPPESLVAEEVPGAADRIAAAAANTDRQLRDLSAGCLGTPRVNACARAGRLVGMAAIRVQNAVRAAADEPGSPVAVANLNSALALLDDTIDNLQILARRNCEGDD